MFILDTNVVSELRKAAVGKADKQVIAWAKGVPTSSLYLSSITILEIEWGILLKERKDQSQGAILRAWFENHVQPAFSDRVLPIDTAVAKRCAKLHVPNPCSDRDAFIMATALAHGMTLVTRNIDDFKHFGGELLNPWQ